MKRLTTIACAAAVSLTTLSSCSNDPTVTNKNGGTPSITFQQIDRLGRPGVKELYLVYAKHDAFNRLAPTTDVAQTAPQIDSFMTATAGRSPAISQYVQALLAPDALVANLADPSASASYLGYETSAQIASDCNGAPATAFGGRSLTDDVVNAMLGLAFGNLATASNLKAPTPNLGQTPPLDDGAEQNGTNGRPNLTNQLTSCGNKGLTLQQFPYLGAPL